MTNIDRPSAGNGRAEFAARVAAALNRRLYPNGWIHAAHLARYISVVPETVWGWQSGNHGPAGWHLCALVDFFDESFAAEIMGPRGLALKRRRPVAAASAVPTPAPAPADDAELPSPAPRVRPQAGPRTGSAGFAKAGAVA